ncbi:unnamed protein product [Lathyrus oleraceus]
MVHEAIIILTNRNALAKELTKTQIKCKLFWRVSHCHTPFSFIDRIGSAGSSTPPIAAAAPATFYLPFFHSSSEGRVCYLTMCARAYPKKLAFQYLEELRNEFERVNGAQIETAARPYAFIKFDTFIQETKKLYQDTHTQRNTAKLNDELYEVHQIMTRNVQEVLGVGKQLDRLYYICIQWCWVFLIDIWLINPFIRNEAWVRICKMFLFLLAYMCSVLKIVYIHLSAYLVGLITVN